MAMMRSTRYVAYNVLPGKKRIISEPLMGHAVPRRIKAAFHQAVMRHIRHRNKE